MYLSTIDETPTAFGGRDVWQVAQELIGANNFEELDTQVQSSIYIIVDPRIVFSHFLLSSQLSFVVDDHGLVRRANQRPHLLFPCRSKMEPKTLSQYETPLSLIIKPSTLTVRVSVGWLCSVAIDDLNRCLILEPRHQKGLLLKMCAYAASTLNFLFSICSISLMLRGFFLCSLVVV